MQIKANKATILVHCPTNDFLKIGFSLFTMFVTMFGLFLLLLSGYKQSWPRRVKQKYGQKQHIIVYYQLNIVHYRHNA